MPWTDTERKTGEQEYVGPKTQKALEQRQATNSILGFDVIDSIKAELVNRGISDAGAKATDNVGFSNLVFPAVELRVSKSAAVTEDFHVINQFIEALKKLQNGKDAIEKLTIETDSGGKDYTTYKISARTIEYLIRGLNEIITNPDDKIQAPPARSAAR